MAREGEPRENLAFISIIDIPRAELCPDIVNEVDKTKPTTIALYGVNGALVKRFLADGFNRVRESFPNVTFIGVDIAPTASEDAKNLNLSWHSAVSYLSAEEFHNQLGESGNTVTKDGQIITIDGVTGAVPPNRHLEIATRWAGRKTEEGKVIPIWTEKPLVTPVELPEMLELMQAFPDSIFPVDFFNGSAPIHYLLHNPEILKSIGKITRLDGRTIEIGGVEKGREYLTADVEKSGGGLGIDMVIHLAAIAYVALPAAGVSDKMVINKVVRGRYVNAQGQEAPGTEETYMWLHAKAGDVEVYMDGGKGTDALYYGVTLHGENGQIEIFTGTEEAYPYIRTTDNNTGKETVYRFPGEGVGYGGIFLDYLLKVYGSEESCSQTLEERKNGAIDSLVAIVDAYEIDSGEMVMYQEGKESPEVPVTPFGSISPIAHKLFQLG